MSSFIRVALMTATAGAIALGATAASANVTITDSTNSYKAGIGPDGELYDNQTGVGLQNPNGADYIRPGTPRDSWGITGSSGSAYADYAQNNTGGITGTTTTSDANSATTVSTTGAGLTVSQYFTFFAPNILSIQETVTNTNNFDVDGIIFRRNVDLDVNPTAFAENTVGAFGTNPAVVGNSYNGFENPNPAGGAFNYQCGASCNVGPGDWGAGIDISLGSLSAGNSITFAFYYGINQPGQDLHQLFNQAQGLGLSYLIGSQSSENGEYPSLGAGSAILGVSNINVVAHAVPEPASWALMLGGFGLIGSVMRRRRTAVRFA